MLYEQLLQTAFGLHPEAVTPVKGGWSAKAYRVDAGNRAYFLKVYDKSLPTVRPWIERIDAYIEVLGWLSKTKELHGLVAEPIPALHGGYQVETEENVFLLFAFVPGETPGERGLSRAQTAELGGILARLHGFGEGLPFDTAGLTEDISLFFCDNLESYLAGIGGGEGDALSHLVAPHAGLLRAAIAETVRLRDAVRLTAKPLVLCHTDAHENNVIQGDRLVLVDWEDLRLAPAEADLFMHALSPYWAAFWAAYSSARPGFRINEKLLRFYLLRRRLEDAWYFLSRVLYDGPDEALTAVIHSRLAMAFSETEQLLSTSLVF